MVKSWDDFENGCIPMLCGANTVRLSTARRTAHSIVTLFVRLYVCSRRRVLIVSILACYCVCCDLLLLLTTAGDVSFWCHCSIAGNVGHYSIAVYSNKSALQTDKSAL